MCPRPHICDLVGTYMLKMWAHICLKCDIDVINHARKSLLFDGSNTWIKKQGLFDVSMGAYHGAEVCELVGTYMLNVLSKKYNKNDFGLYRDDGLAVLKKKSGRNQNR